MKTEKKTQAEGVQEEELDTKILEAVDLSLPDTFQEEAMGAELLEHITIYHRAMASNKAARHSGDQGKAEQMFRLASFSRLAAAIIQAEHPGAKAVADEMAKYRVMRARAERQAAITEE